MNKAKEIFRRLHEKTKRGEIKWEETEKETEFQAALPAYSFRIVKEGDRDLYSLKIFNQEGKLIEEIASFDISADSLTVQFEMKELYDMARRAAMHVEEALDDILSELGGEVEHGTKK